MSKSNPIKEVVRYRLTNISKLASVKHVKIPDAPPVEIIYGSLAEARPGRFVEIKDNVGTSSAQTSEPHSPVANPRIVTFDGKEGRT
jgi:hypothetical protein